MASHRALKHGVKPDGMLAQLVEQRTFNPFVVGSTPAHPTKIPEELAVMVSSSFHLSQPKRSHQADLIYGASIDAYKLS